MSNYHVYGLGNALLDMEYRVSQAQLETLGIDKGVMTLVDAAQQNLLLSQLGDATKQSAGGSAANTIIAIAQFGGSSYYSCKVADDPIGHFYLNDLNIHGVRNNLRAATLPAGTTGKCLVMVTPDADRTMNTYLGISSELSQRELSHEAIAAAEYVYIEGYLVTSKNSLAAAVQARESAQSKQVRVSLSLSDPNMTRFFREQLLQIIGPGIDLLFCNEAEALSMSDSKDLHHAATFLRSLSKQVVITQGPEGALVLTADEHHKIAPVKVTAIDTVGAGDMFAGAFLYAITHGSNRIAAGNFAAQASAQLVTQLGPRMSTQQAQALVKHLVA